MMPPPPARTETLPPRRAGRNGRARTALILALLGLVLLAVGLAYLLFEGERAPRDGEVVGAPRDAAPATIDDGLEQLQLESPRTAAGRTDLPDVAAWSLHGIDVSAGVRLPGAGRLEGRVIDRATGAGVPAARVDLLAITPAARDTLSDVLHLAKAGGGMERRALPLAVARTDASGAFHFNGVRSGIYFLDARGDYHVPDESVQVRVDSDGSGGPVTCHVRRGGRVVGQVVRADGTPVARAKVAVAQGPGHVITAFRAGELRQIEDRTERDGRFVLAGVTPGEGYVLHAVGTGFAIAHVDLPPVRAGEDQEVQVRVAPGATLEGRVLSVAADAGSEAEAESSGTPLAGARIAAMPRGLRDMQFVEEILAATLDVTDADGRYVLRDVPGGDLDLIALAPGHVPGQSAPVRVAEGGRVTAPDLCLRRGPVLRGTVVDRAGLPLAGTHVRWFTGSFDNFEDFNISTASLMHQALGDFRFPTSAADGAFESGPFPGRPPYFCYFFKAGYNFERYEWEPERDGNDVVVALQRGGSIEGVVVDAVTKAPIARYVIGGRDRIDMELDAPSSLNAVAGGQLVEDPEGRFRVESVLPGKATLSFTAPGYQRREEQRIPVVEGEVTAELVIELTPGGTLAGVVVDEEGEPVAGAEVAALAGGAWNIGRSFARTQEHRESGLYSDTAAETFTNGIMSFATRMGTLGEGAVCSGPDGSFELQSVAAGKVSVVARHRDYALGQSEVLALAAGESREGLRVELPRGAELYGRVTDRFDRPVEQAVLLAISPAEFSGDDSAEAAVYQGVTNEAGHYAIEHMAGGGYFVVMTRLDAALDPMALLGRLDLDVVTVPPHTRTRHDLVDDTIGACRVFGRVTSGGVPMTEGGVVAVSSDPHSVVGVDVKLARVEADGSYEFSGLVPGAYEFVYQAPGNELRLDVEVPDRPEFEADLALPSGGVSGRVLDGLTGEPIADATVYLRRIGGERPRGFVAEMLSTEGTLPRRSTDAEGGYRFDGHEDGEYELTVRPPRSGELRDAYAAAGPLALTLADGRTTEDFDVHMTAALSVSGFVYAPDGAPVRRAAVSLHVPGQVLPFGDTARSKRDGAFELRGVGPGTYELVAEGEGYGAGVLANVELRDAPLQGLAVHLVPGVPLRILAVDAEGEPLTGAYADVRTSTGRAVSGSDPEQDMFSWFSSAGMSQADGRLDAGLLAPGTYDVVVRRGALRGERMGLVIEAGPAVTIEVAVK